MLPRQCCAAGSLHTGTPSGTISKVHGLDSYIAHPPSGTDPKGIVVIISDIFGWDLPNTRILADEYAEKGPFTVYVPECGGIPHDLIINMEALQKPGVWSIFSKVLHALKLLRHALPFFIRNRESRVKPGMTAFFRGLRQAEGATLPVGAAGFCWGGSPVVKFTHDTEKAGNGLSLVDVGFIAHPAFMKMPRDADMVAKPLSVAAAGKDGPPLLKQGEVLRGVLEEKNRVTEEREGAGGVRHEYVLYEGAAHGFAVRANEENKAMAEQGREAQEQAINWFRRWFDEWRRD